MAPHREQAQGSPTNAADEYECNDCQRKVRGVPCRFSARAAVESN